MVVGGTVEPDVDALVVGAATEEVEVIRKVDVIT
jgi:hypothetical protein